MAQARHGPCGVQVFADDVSRIDDAEMMLARPVRLTSFQRNVLAPHDAEGVAAIRGGALVGHQVAENKMAPKVAIHQILSNHSGVDLAIRAWIGGRRSDGQSLPVERPETGDQATPIPCGASRGRSDRLIRL